MKKSRDTGAKNVMRAASGPGLRRLGASMPDALAGDQAREPPGEVPAVAGRRPRGGRQRAGGEVDVAEIGLHRELEVAHLGDPAAA